MKFGFLSEADPIPGQTYAQRYQDLEDEVIHAEKMGFDFFGVSEQHFALGVASVSAPEVIFPYLMAKTTKIRFRHAIMLLPYMINHPLRVAERIATQDILSNGRIELGVGRGNTTLTLDAFGVSPEMNKAQSAEALDIIIGALTQDPFSYKGEFFDIPKRGLVPKPITRPHPPIWQASMSPDSIREAAEKGLGIWATASDRGWKYLEDAISIYRKGIAKAEANGLHVNNNCAFVCSAHCAATKEIALQESAHKLIDMRKLASAAYEKLANISSDYGYMQEIADIVREKGDDINYMLNESASLIIGSPDDFIRNIEKYQALGADEVWFRIDSLGIEKNLQTIEMLGRYVLPKFRDPGSVIEDPAVLRARILAARKERELAAGGNGSVATPPAS